VRRAALRAAKQITGRCFASKLPELVLALLCALFASGCSVTAQARLSRAGEAAVRVGEAVAVRVIEDEIQRLIAD
jgi:hypothetical protein